MPAGYDNHMFSDIPIGKLRKYCNLMGRIFEDPDCRRIELFLRPDFTLESSVDFVGGLAEQRKAKEAKKAKEIREKVEAMKAFK
jgi:hypothetical protein